MDKSHALALLTLCSLLVGCMAQPSPRVVGTSTNTAQPPETSQPSPAVDIGKVIGTFTPTSLPAPTKTPIRGASSFPFPTAIDSETSLVHWAELKMVESYYAAWLPDSQGIVFAGVELQGLGARTYLYDVYMLKPLWAIDDASSRIAISPEGDVIVGGGGALQFWDTLTGQEIAPPYGGNAMLFPAFLPNGSVLLIGVTWAQGFVGEDSITNIGIWEPEERRWDIIIEHAGLLSNFIVSPDGTMLATMLGALLDSEGKKHHEVFIWDLATRSVRCNFLGDNVAFNPNDSFLAIVDNSLAEIGKVLIYDTKTCQLLKTLYQAEYIWSLAYYPDGQMLALVSEPEGTIRLLDAATGQLLYEQSGLWDTVWLLAFSPDGKFLMSRESYGTEYRISVWKVITTPVH